VGSAGSSNLREVTGVVVDEYRHRLTGGPSPVELHEEGMPAGKIAIDPDALGIVLHNLIDNAIAHGRPGRPVIVTLGPGARLSVVNEGEAIAADELPKLRERFVRGETEAEGSGLGLSIVDAIMRESGGSLSIHSPAAGRTDGFEAVLSFRELL
jgi:two-component system OmpR family sensor kinase